MAEVTITSADRSPAGLCAGCLHARRIASSRGSIFFLCQRSASDPAFPKYPRLPVLECRGYEPDAREMERSSP